MKKKDSIDCVYNYITWLVKTQPSTTECSFVKIFVLRLTTDDIGLKQTNHIFGCFGEVHQTNILIPSKIPFI